MQNLKQIQQWLDQTKSIADYRQSIRAAIYALWSGQSNYFNFTDDMVGILTRQLRIAWREGAAVCGIASDELSAVEIAARDELINSQFPYLAGFAGAIEEGSKANGGKLGPLLERGELWVRQYDKAYKNAQAMACRDKKARFVLGPTEKHCRTCFGLNGRVYRYSTWVQNGAVPPRNPNFECGAASHCDCRLEDTDEPMTKGPFPRRLLV
jgi:hypothetical protein